MRATASSYFWGSVMISDAFFFFNDTATTEIYTLSYTLSLHDALPISPLWCRPTCGVNCRFAHSTARSEEHTSELQSHSEISYAVFCLKKNNKINVKNKHANGATHSTHIHLACVE